MKTYITYGKGNVLDTSRLPDLNELDLTPSFINKIPGTLWGSPVDANFGWKEWCHNNDFHTTSFKTSFKWTIKEDSRLLFISTLEDLEKVPFVETEFGLLQIDFQKIANDYDAMEISMDNLYIGHMFLSEKERAFNSWDCDSIMVLNKDIIIPVND